MGERQESNERAQKPYLLDQAILYAFLNESCAEDVAKNPRRASQTDPCSSVYHNTCIVDKFLSIKYGKLSLAGLTGSFLLNNSAHNKNFTTQDGIPSSEFVTVVIVSISDQYYITKYFEFLDYQ